MKLTKKLISRCAPIIKYNEAGERLLVGYRRKSSVSKKARDTYMLSMPQVLPPVIAPDGNPLSKIVRDLVEKAQSEIDKEKLEQALKEAEANEKAS
jgi:hypothetical protein